MSEFIYSRFDLFDLGLGVAMGCLIGVWLGSVLARLD